MSQSSININLLDIPEEVIIGNVCQYLPHNDVLRLRRVCKTLKLYAEKHLLVRKPNTYKEIHIDDTSLPVFVELGVRATRFFFDITSPEFFIKFEADIARFLELCGDLVTHIQVTSFHAFIAPREMEFYQSLTNLKHLVIDSMHAVTQLDQQFPPNFQELETLKIELIALNHELNFELDANLCEWVWDLFDYCDKLISFKIAKGPDGFEDLGDIRRVTQAIPLRKTMYPNGPNLKYFDMEHVISIGDENVIDVINLLDISNRYEVKLLNVHAKVIERIQTHTMNDFEQTIGGAIMSVRNITSPYLLTTMPHLEKVTITRIQDCFLPNEWDNCYVDWPKLQSLDITLNTTWQSREDAMKMKSSIFDREVPVRQQLTELSLGFDWERVQSGWLLVYVGPSSINSSCPNLTKLSLRNYPHPAVNDMNFSELWEGLPLLQELCLERCITLYDSDFIGKQAHSPSFFQLKHLKKLTLRSLDTMPKVTDKCFSIVICHMKLTHLILESDEPIKTITMGGIESLLTGEFATTIEKFPFHGWSLDGTSHHEFSNLAYKFRSSSLHYPFI